VGFLKKTVGFFWVLFLQQPYHKATLYRLFMCEMLELPYSFEYNTQNFIPKTLTQSSVCIINEVLDVYAFTPEGS